MESPYLIELSRLFTANCGSKACKFLPYFHTSTVSTQWDSGFITDGVVVNQFIHRHLQNSHICAQSCSWLQIREYWEGLLFFFRLLHAYRCLCKWSLVYRNGLSRNYTVRLCRSVSFRCNNYTTHFRQHICKSWFYTPPKHVYKIISFAECLRSFACLTSLLSSFSL